VGGLAAALTNNIIFANGVGAIKAQHDGTNWAFTGGVSLNGGPTVTKILTATATLDFPSIAAGGYADIAAVLTGATVNSSVEVGPPAAPTPGIIVQAFISAANTLTFRANNITTAAIDPPSAVWRGTAIVF
jgi:hypothetical protein